MLTGGFVIHLLMGSLICSGTLYVGEYLPVKQLVPPIAGGPRGFGFIIILSGEYIIPYMFNVYYCFSFFLKLLTGNHKSYLTTYHLCNLAQGCFYKYKCQGFPHLIFFFFLVV